MKLPDLHHFAMPALVGTAVGAVLMMSTTPMIAHDGPDHVFETGGIEFKPGPATLPTGAQFAVLVGDPAKDGPFVMRLKLPAGYAIPPRRHPKEEHVTVISGGFGMAMGQKHDRDAAPLLAPGAFIRIPTDQAHFAWTEQETVVQINAMGPFGIQYVDPKDDPRID